MKKMIFILAMTVPIFLKSNAQTGIGTKNINPDIILQIESSPSPSSDYYGGLLLPRVELISRDIFLPITGNSQIGLIVYNLSTSGIGQNAVYPGFYFWNSNSNWQRVEQRKSGATAQFSNQNSTTNLNNEDGTYADIFANQRFNNDPSLFERINNTTLSINEVGYYKIILNLDLASDGGADNFGIELIVNGQRNIISENIYIPGRWDSESGEEEDFPNGRSYILYVPINSPGHRIRMITYEIDPNTDVFFKNANTSTFSIEKLR